MIRTAIVAAMPGEVKPLVQSFASHWQHERHEGVDLWALQNEEEELVVACAGAGQAAATRAFAAAEARGPVDLVFSIGWAGALTPAFAPGTAYNVAGVVDALTGERFHCEAGAGEHWLATSPSVAGEAEKRRLAATYHAVLVDMEAAAIARLAQMRGIPFYCIKGVSDGAADRLPDLNRFMTRNGEFRLAAFVLFAILRPWHWPVLLRMGENSKKAARAIAASVLDILDIEGETEKRNGDPGTR